MDNCGVCNGDNSSCTDCAGIANGTAVLDDCGVCNQAYIYNFITHVPTYVDNANALIPGVDFDPSQQFVVLPGDPGDPNFNASCSGCTPPNQVLPWNREEPTPPPNAVQHRTQALDLQALLVK